MDQGKNLAVNLCVERMRLCVCVRAPAVFTEMTINHRKHRKVKSGHIPEMPRWLAHGGDPKIGCTRNPFAKLSTTSDETNADVSIYERAPDVSCRHRRRTVLSVLRLQHIYTADERWTNTNKRFCFHLKLHPRETIFRRHSVKPHNVYDSHVINRIKIIV